MLEFGRVPRKSKICASTKKLCERVLKNGRIRVSTEKWKDLGEDQDKVEYMRDQKIVRRSTEKSRISVSIGK